MKNAEDTSRREVTAEVLSIGEVKQALAAR